MATNLRLDDTLIAKAARLGKHRTKKAAVTQTLIDYIHRSEQDKIGSLFTTIPHMITGSSARDHEGPGGPITHNRRSRDCSAAL